jgi:hypothetical protein
LEIRINTKIEKKTGDILTMYNINYPKPGIYRIYVKKKKEARSSLRTEAAYTAETILQNIIIIIIIIII